MDEQRLDLGVVGRLEVQSFGEPGNRTFRMLAETDEGSVSLWLEKEQVVMLGSAVDSLLARVPDQLGVTPESDVLKSFRGDLEVRVGSLSIGYDADHNGFSVEASDFLSPFSLDSITLLASRDQFTRVQEQAEQIASSGRPRCPLCGRPITDGHHFCPESNGHADLVVPE